MFHSIYNIKHGQLTKKRNLMSTTFKIIENHIQNSKTSPKKSIGLGSSQQLSPSSRVAHSIHDSQSFQEEEVLKLQIKQLQRQNKFLKKKIAELTEQLNVHQQQPKKKIVSGKGLPKQEIDPTHMTAEFFFKQINNLMNSLADLFRVQFTNDEVKQYSLKFAGHDETIAANKKYTIYKKFTLSRKLQKVTLQGQQKKYPLLLQIFTQYYKAKQECDRYVRERVDSLSSRVLQLNKMIFQYASRKKSNLKGSCIKSQYHFEDINQRNMLTIPLPWSLKVVNPMQTSSYTTQNSKKRDQEYDMRNI